MRLVHFSDIHHQIDWPSRSLKSSGWRGAPGRFELHALGRFARFSGVGDRIRRLVDRVGALDADRLVLTGDLSALGDEAELTEVRALLEPLVATGRLAVIPGNHDRYSGSRAFERLFGPLLMSDLPEHADARGYPYVKLIDSGFALVGVDSTRVPAWSHYIVGRLGSDQRARLARVLDDPRVCSRTVLLLCHHGPLGPDGSFVWRECGLLDRAPLMRLLHQRRVVMLHGHSHHRYWHRAKDGRPHLIGGGSSTEPGHEGFFVVDVEDHERVEARAVS